MKKQFYLNKNYISTYNFKNNNRNKIRRKYEEFLPKFSNQNIQSNLHSNKTDTQSIKQLLWINILHHKEKTLRLSVLSKMLKIGCLDI